VQREMPLVLSAGGLGCGTVALLVLVWFACKSSHCCTICMNLMRPHPAISQYTFHVHDIVDFFTIPVVYCLYPETKKGSLEEMDLLFASDKLWVREAEKEFARLKMEHADMLHIASDGFDVDEKDGARIIEGSEHSSA